MSKQHTVAFASHGRGGAGNMADITLSTKLKPSDLETPTLKTPVVTTGRGGTGNMARNDDPIETRLRQDVAAVPRRLSTNAQYAGRGGAGNVFMGDDALEATQRLGGREHAVDDSPERRNSIDKLDKTEETMTKKMGWLFGKKA